MKVAAVVVTFNRKDMLLETLRGLQAQTHPLEVVYLIDNASSDGTAELLAASGLLDWDKLQYHRLDTNTGGAGGFSTGVGLAMAGDCDWIWTMDDDVEPAPEALATLLRYSDISECMNSTKVFTENGEVQYWEQYFDFATGRLIDLKNAAFANGRPWCPVNVTCFEGMLVSRGIVEKIGVPDASYFIYHDDTLFGIKASLHTNVIFVRDAIFHKKIYGYGSATPMRCYYMNRNLFKLKRDAFATGQLGTSSAFTNFLFLQVLLNQSLKAFMEKPTLEILKSLARGFWHGLRGR